VNQHDGFTDGSASNFLIADIGVRAYRYGVQKEATAGWKGRLVIGCSDQLPNELRAYRLLDGASTGAVLLGRHGTTYSADASDVSAYPQLLAGMLSSVLRNIPAPLQTRAREGLIKRWNRDWGVETDDRGAVALESDQTAMPLCPAPQPRVQQHLPQEG